MSVAEVYEASVVKPRRRATRDEMEVRATFLIAYAARQRYGSSTTAPRSKRYPASIRPRAAMARSSARFWHSVAVDACPTPTLPT